MCQLICFLKLVSGNPHIFNEPGRLLADLCVASCRRHSVKANLGSNIAAASEPANSMLVTLVPVNLRMCCGPGLLLAEHRKLLSTHVKKHSSSA